MNIKTLELSFVDGSEKVTVSKLHSGEVTCSCMKWRINQATKTNLDYRCTHIYKAQRKGLK
jgi:hypothetical protein